MMMMKNSAGNKNNSKEKDLFHVIHKVPYGDTPYVKAKHAQLIEKNPEMAIVWFWKAINAGDRVDSALKDMAVVMKQLDRTEEAIEAIKSFRGRCSKNSQDSLDNVLIDLYKKCGRVDEQVDLLKRKLRQIYQGDAFNGKPTKTARSHGKKFQVTVQQEISRLLGNLGWAYMQQAKYLSAEGVYRKAQMIEPDANKACNLAMCLIKQGRYEEARSNLDDVLEFRVPGSEDRRTSQRAEELLRELEYLLPRARSQDMEDILLGNILDVDLVNGLDQIMGQEYTLFRSKSKRLPIFEEISSFRNHQLVC
ncbi:PREDICTED: protein SULFUR DEFICIENCY-INDUCED 1 [Tarenaya hassleriana]|uniref:protein SULFUR DEFICIENCY-INDUCED 1 n=1 Tax=Tarenaya hassleriana TaxID=28532 RepID=UPI00053CA108|nr:PREDICTED: protein SULFUR DEFICIENCY-INDUCED 1 [Tarenaya hassleriana]